MKSGTKFWLIIAAIFVLVGCIAFGGVMAMLNWDFSKLSTTEYETNSYEINESFSDISIVTNTADITFVRSESSMCTVECFERKNLRHTVTVSDGSLVIDVLDTRQWYEHIGIGFKTPEITVYLPESEYAELSVKSNTGDVSIPEDFSFLNIDITESTGEVACSASASGKVKIKTTTGSISVENVTAGSLDLSVSTGRVTVSDASCEGNVNVKVTTGRAELSDITAKNLSSSGSTGDIILTNVIAEEKLTVERSTGDVIFNGVDAAEIFAETDTGNIKGTLLSEKVFVVRTDTGSVSVPSTSSGGRCELITDTGNIKITLN